MIKTTLKIDGMMCGMCESHINDAIRNSFDVKKVNSSHTKGETVIVSKEALDEDKIKSVIDKTGYELQSVSSEELEEKKGLFGFLKK
ncbi:MAG: heavy-metal-associated domain-containing protein [Clostridiales bacterium]|jgi:copper chaperone|nr:heavy-metal-associated domain-containing protein [Oscillospiraceae bacterium]MBD9070319.1 heavy-metal-associated domain-containing protein [Oscillospiraceae bacterium]MEE0638930.1 heavy metal-associated domain-containing protein [Acutalibacteraceae bacterium]